MKSLDPALIAHLGARGQICSHVLVWFSAVQRLDGVTAAPWGVWTGDADRTFTIDGSPRTYYGAGAMGPPGALSFEVGYVVRLHRLQLSHLHADVKAALASTEIRLRPVELHQVHLVPGSHDLVAAPLLRLRGAVESLSLPRLAIGAFAPQQRGEPLARFRACRLQREIGQHGAQARRGDREDGRLRPLHDGGEAAEKAQLDAHESRFAVVALARFRRKSSTRGQPRQTAGARPFY